MGEPSRLKPKNGDVFTAWRIYERAVTEMAPLLDAFVTSSKLNRIAAARQEAVMRVQNVCLIALTIAVVALPWRMG